MGDDVLGDLLDAGVDGLLLDGDLEVDGQSLGFDGDLYGAGEEAAAEYGEPYVLEGAYSVAEFYGERVGVYVVGLESELDGAVGDLVEVGPRLETSPTVTLLV